MKASIAFDAVGGELTRRLGLAMPPKSRIVIYRALADEPCQIDSKDFFFRDKKLAKSAFVWLRDALLPPMKPASHIVIGSSMAAINGSPLSGSYAGAKRMLWLMEGLPIVCSF